METPKTITFGISEHYSSRTYRKPITINISDYPELDGKTEDEIIDYIRENNETMKPSVESEYLASLWDQLMEQHIIEEKINDEITEIIFN